MYTCVVPIFILLMFWGRTLFQLWSSSSVWREGRERRRRRFRRFALFGNGSNRWTEHRQRFFKDGFFSFFSFKDFLLSIMIAQQMPCHAMPQRMVTMDCDRPVHRNYQINNNNNVVVYILLLQKKCAQLYGYLQYKILYQKHPPPYFRK